MRNTKKMILLAFFVAMASVLHVVETWIPVPIPVPGIKLGLANIISLAAIILFGWKEALYIAVLRVGLGSFFSGTLLGPSFIMSISGALISIGVMFYMYRKFTPVFSLVGISVTGAVAHNIMQIVMASIMVYSYSLLWYIPYLILFAVPTGIATGLTAVYFSRKFLIGYKSNLY